MASVLSRVTSVDTTTLLSSLLIPWPSDLSPCLHSIFLSPPLPPPFLPSPPCAPHPCHSLSQFPLFLCFLIPFSFLRQVLCVCVCSRLALSDSPASASQTLTSQACTVASDSLYLVYFVTGLCRAPNANTCAGSEWLRVNGLREIGSESRPGVLLWVHEKSGLGLEGKSSSPSQGLHGWVGCRRSLPIGAVRFSYHTPSFSGAFLTIHL